MTDSFLDAVGLGRYVGSWTLNGLSSTATFRSSTMWGLVKVRGRFARLEGEGHLGQDGLASGRLVLHAASLDTNKAKRDDRLRSVDCLSVDKYPEIVFNLSSVDVTGLSRRVRIDGTLTIIDNSLLLVFDAEIIGQDNLGVTLHAVGSVDRSRWGIAHRRKLMAKMDTGFEVFARLVRAEPDS
jgi:polyisoprenoid-binding protein YceI